MKEKNYGSLSIMEDFDSIYDMFYNINKDIFSKKVNNDNGNWKFDEALNEWILTLDVPGYSKDDLKVVLNKRTMELKITGKIPDRFVEYEYTLKHLSEITKVKVVNGLLTINVKVPPSNEDFEVSYAIE